MSLWKLNPDGTATAIGEERLATEQQIESAVESAPELLGIDVLIVGRQTQTPSGPLDLLGIDGDGRMVVIENKRDRTPREVLAQAIDYAAWVNTLTFDEVDAIYSKYRAASNAAGVDLADDFEERFGEELDAIAETPRIIIVASRLDDSTERMIDFLSDSFGVSVNAVLFQPFEGGLIGRTWLRPDVSPSRSSGRRSSSNSASRDEAKTFWDAWLPIGRSVLHDIRLPQNGPRSVLIKRRIEAGLPVSLVVWVSSSEAYAEIQCDDPEPAANERMLQALLLVRGSIEEQFGAELQWRNLEENGLLTKRTKIVAPKVPIESRGAPSDAGLSQLAESARRLVDAVRPHLAAAIESAAEAVEMDPA
jgi:hypothetical protein